MSLNLNLHKSDARYQRIVSAVNSRVQSAEDNFRRTRYAAWRSAEEMHASYVPESEADAIARGKREAGTPQPLTVILPASYAMLMSAHTYWTSVFLSRTPIHQFTGRTSMPADSELRLESIIDYQTNVGQHMPPLYVWLMDIGKYGLGAMTTYWVDEFRTFSRIIEREIQMEYNGIPIPDQYKTETVRQVIRSKSYSGARLRNIWPFDLRLDSSVPVWDYQRGEFCGHRFYISPSELVEGEKTKRYLKGSIEALKEHESQRRNEETSAVTELPSEVSIPPKSGGYIGEQMAIRLVPSDWNLGNSTYPEIWLFTVVDKSILIEAKPQGEAHCQFPFVVTPMEVEGYHLPVRGMYEVLEPYQNMLDWFYNTHFFAARKNINGIIVADPSRIVMKDLLEPDGAIVRTKGPSYGTPLRDAIHQVPLHDPTIQHVADGQRVMEFMQRVFGVSDNLMGMLDPGGRKTATEVRQSNTLGMNRLKTAAEWFSTTGFSPLATLLVQLTQQHMTEPMEVRLAGSIHGQASQYVMVSPEDILGQFDFVPVDGTLPIDRLALATLWTQLFQQMQQMPEVMQSFDLPKIFGYVAQLSGLKNLDQFRRQNPIQTQIFPDEVVQQQATAGNVVPIMTGERSAAQPLTGLGPLQ